MATAIRLVFALALVVTAAGYAGAKDDPVPADQFVLYRVAGRTWMLKRSPKPGQEGGDDQITYLRHEVAAVWDDRAEMRQAILDANKKESGGAATVVKVAFQADNLIFRDPVGFRKTKQERIKVPAGTFDCVRWDNEIDGGASLWRSVDYPTLVVKSDDRFGTRELIELDVVEGDPGYKAPKAKKKQKGAAADAEVTDTRLFGTKGRKWIVTTTTQRGKNRVRSFLVQQYEVTAADKDSCELEITDLTLTLEKLKGAKVEKVSISFADGLRDWLEPKQRSKLDRTEKRITIAGLLECNVYAYEDEDGRACTAWYAKAWPGLVVRLSVTGEDFEQLTELVQFDE